MTSATTLAKAAPASLSLADLDMNSACANAHEFEYLHPDGRPSGVFLTVIGSQSPVVQNWLRKTLNARRTREAIAVKRGKDIETTVEDDEEFGNDAAAVRLVGWRGITEPFSPGLALQLVERNAELRAQVFKASNDLGNFTKG